MPPVIDTPRLVLRPLVFDDAGWVYELNHDPLWERFIGNRGVATVDDAHDYIARSQQQMQEWGFSLLAITEADTERPVGLCGLIRRPYFEPPELGFALLSEARGKGYALEAARYMVNFAKRQLGLSELLASVKPNNSRSIRLLESAGFTRMGHLFVSDLAGQLLYRHGD